MESLNRKVYCYKNAGAIKLIRIVPEGKETNGEGIVKKKHRKQTHEFSS